MNAKKCKALRRMVRAELSHREVEPNQLVYSDIRKLIGWTFPQGWIKARFTLLATVKGPWFEEAVKQATPQYARQALNKPGTARYIYRKTKAAVKAGVL